MGYSYHDRQAILARLAERLIASGEWNVLGYAKDESDIQSDYWHPASWKGVATHKASGVILVVGAVHPPIGTKVYKTGFVDGPCSACKGTGKELHDAEAVTLRALVGGTTHAVPAVRAGDPCRYCKGTGRREEVRNTELLYAYPDAFVSNTRPDRWSLQNPNGRGSFLATGQLNYGAAGHGPNAKAATESDFEVIRAKVAAFLSKPTATDRPTAPPAPTAVTDIVVRTSAVREDVAEILFPEKPSEAIRSELKAAGFRWSPTNKVWYGKKNDLPARYPFPSATERR